MMANNIGRAPLSDAEFWSQLAIRPELHRFAACRRRLRGQSVAVGLDLERRADGRER